MLPKGYIGYVVRTLARKLGYKRDDLMPLERSLMDHLQSVVNRQLAEAIKSQLEEINLVQRISTRRTECNLYKIGKKGVDLQRRKLIELAPGDVRIATINFETVSGLKQAVEVHAVDGILFSFEFGANVGKHLRSPLSRVLELKLNQRADG